MLIICIQNDANGTHHAANYDFSVNVNMDTIAVGRVEGFDRDLGWKELVRRVVEASGSAWSFVKPATPGYYWAYENLPEEDADVMLMRVDESLAKCFWAEDGMEFPIEHFSRWIGPLSAPRTP